MAPKLGVETTIVVGGVEVITEEAAETGGVADTDKLEAVEGIGRLAG